MQSMLYRTVLSWGGQSRTLDLGEISQPYILLPNEETERYLVFLPPLGDGWSTWFRLLAQIRGLGGCLALGPPRASTSDDVFPSVGSLAQWVSSVERLLAALGLARIHLVGSSLGAIVALRVARLCPERIAGVFALGLRPDLETLSFLRDCFDVRDLEDVETLLSKSWTRRPALGQAALERLFAILRSPGFRSLLEEVSESNPRRELEDTLACGVPVSFLYGRDDRLLAGAGNPQEPAASGVRSLCLDQCGHYPHIERTRECARWITEQVQQDQISSPCNPAELALP